jgi:hypothetical protein
MQGKRFNPIYKLSLLFNSNTWMSFEGEAGKTIDFDAFILKDGFSNGNVRSNVFLYNLSEDKRNALESQISLSEQSSLQFKLECKLNNITTEYGVLTYDDIDGAYNERGEPDFKTNLILKSGENAKSFVISSASHPPGSQLTNALNAECKKLIDGKSVTSINVRVIDQVLPYGLAYHGNVYDSIAKLCYETNHSLFIENGVAKIYPRNWNDINNLTHDLNFANGLLEAPHIGQTSFTKKYRKKNSKVSFLFKSLLLPGISLNDVIKVLGVNYTVKRINHVIQTSSGVAHSVIEGLKND